MSTNMHKPLASIVVVGFNGQKHVEACLSSLGQQTVHNLQYEILYVDNCSSDDSLSYVQNNFAGIKIIALDENIGYGGAVNRAVKNALGEIIIVLNQDTVVANDWVESIVSVLMDPKLHIDVAVSNQLFPEDSPIADEVHNEVNAYQLSCFGYAKMVNYCKSWHPIETMFMSGAAFGFHRSLLESLPYLFDEDFFMYSEDTELSLRLMARNVKISVIPAARLIHKPGSGLYASDLPNFGQLKKLAVKTYVSIHNRFLAYFRNMTFQEFVVFAPFLMLGAGLKAQESPQRVWVRSLYAGGMWTMGVVAMGQLLVQSSKHQAVRQSNLASRNKQQKFALLKKLLFV